VEEIVEEKIELSRIQPEISKIRDGAEGVGGAPVEKCVERLRSFSEFEGDRNAREDSLILPDQSLDFVTFFVDGG
jgi:hypothetical protein